METKFQCWSDIDALPGTSVYPTLVRHFKDGPRYVVLAQIHKAVRSVSVSEDDRTSFATFRASVIDAKCEIVRLGSPEALSDLANTGCIKASVTHVDIATATGLAKALKKMRVSPAIRKALRAFDTSSPLPNATVNCKCPKRKVLAALPCSPPSPDLQVQV